MMMLILLAILTGPYLLLTALNRRLQLGNATRGRGGLIDYERIVRDLIPQLKRVGAEGIIEYPLNKVVY